MQKCSPIEMRKSLEIVEQYKRIGLAFIPVPIYSAEQELMVKEMAEKAFDEIIKIIEQTDMPASDKNKEKPSYS